MPDSARYEALYEELMRRPFPSEGFVVPKRPPEVRHACDADSDDPYDRWLAMLAALTK